MWDETQGLNLEVRDAGGKLLGTLRYNGKLRSGMALAAPPGLMLQVQKWAPYIPQFSRELEWAVAAGEQAATSYVEETCAHARSLQYLCLRFDGDPQALRRLSGFVPAAP